MFAGVLRHSAFAVIYALPFMWKKGACKIGKTRIACNMEIVVFGKVLTEIK